MSADAAPLTKVDSAVQGIAGSPTKEGAPKEKRRASSSVPGVYNINDLGMFTFIPRRLAPLSGKPAASTNQADTNKYCDI